jgi:Na+-transporting NADH:ubiquinone oxidoreductase subunit NqrF
MSIEVEKSDIWKIGRGCWGNNGGYLTIDCNVDTVNIEEILLRSILKCYGEDYTVTNVLEHICKDDEDLIDGYTLVTNLPFEIFEKCA